MKTAPRRMFLATPAVLALVGLAACGSSSTPASSSQPGGSSAGTSAGGGSVIQVVASTNVWGSIAAKIGGEHVQVSSFISEPSQDPHSYEANTQNVLSIKKAGLVIENGGGYDDFMDTMLKAAANPDTKIVNAVKISGKTAPTGGDLNEHVWYDMPTVVKVSNEIATSLGAIDQANAAQFKKNAADFAASLSPITDTLAMIKSKHSGSPVAITEPVPGYMLDAAGLVDKTPEEFSKAIEEGNDIAPAVLQQTTKLFSDHQVDALVYNEQTTGATTDAVKKAADEAQIPVVPVTETLPEGKTFEQWMQANADAIGAALDQAKS